MTPEAWTFAGVCVVQLASLTGIWLKLRTTARDASEAKEYARPTGNGFAGKVLGSLDDIHKDIRGLRADAARDREALTTHLGDHARASLHVPAPRTSPEETP